MVEKYDLLTGTREAFERDPFLRREFGEYDNYVRSQLNDPRANILAAAKLMRIFLDSMCRTAKCDRHPKGPNNFGGFSVKFNKSIMQLYSTAPEARAKFIDEACNKDCGKVVGMDVDKAMLAAMQAAVNDDIPLIWDDNLVDDNVVKHATNAQKP